MHSFDVAYNTLVLSAHRQIDSSESMCIPLPGSASAYPYPYTATCDGISRLVDARAVGQIDRQSPCAGSRGVVTCSRSEVRCKLASLSLSLSFSFFKQVSIDVHTVHRGHAQIQNLEISRRIISIQYVHVHTSVQYSEVFIYQVYCIYQILIDLILSINTGIKEGTELLIL